MLAIMSEAVRKPRKRKRLHRAIDVAARRLRHNPHGQGAMPVSSRLSTWVGIVTACIGGFLGLDAYRADVAKKVDQSVEKTFDLVLRFNEAPLSQTRLKVASYVDAKRYCDARLINRDLVNQDFITVLDFFDVAHACVEAKLCDGPTAAKFLSPYANYQWPVLSGVVEELRAETQSLRADAGFGAGMAAFADAPLAAPPCNGNF